MARGIAERDAGGHRGHLENALDEHFETGVANTGLVSVGRRLAHVGVRLS